MPKPDRYAGKPKLTFNGKTFPNAYIPYNDTAGFKGRFLAAEACGAPQGYEAPNGLTVNTFAEAAKVFFHRNEITNNPISLSWEWAAYENPGPNWNTYGSPWANVSTFPLIGPDGTFYGDWGGH